MFYKPFVELLHAPVGQLTPEIDRAADDFLKAIYNGDIKGGQIHVGLMHSTAAKLVESIEQAFDYSVNYDSTQWGLIDHLHSNIFAFSAAKSLSEYEAFGKMLTDEKGNMRSFGDFKKQVEKLNLRYNELYLEAEYHSAIAQSQNASRWHDIVENREAGAQVEYRTAGDENVRDSHRALDGMVFNIDDNRLDHIAPQNDWGCRCLLVQVDNAEKVTNSKLADAAISEARVPKYFKNNPGKTGKIYSDGHTYFVSQNSKKPLDAVKNYGLKTPGQIYMHPDKLAVAAPSFESLTDLKIWWTQKTIDGGNVVKNNFSIKASALGNLPVTLDNDLFLRFDNPKYVKETRYEFASNIEDIITNPDEVWSTTRSAGHGEPDQLTGFIKFYRKKPVIVVARSVKNKDGFSNIRMTSIYPLDNDANYSGWRSGTLRYRKTD